MQQTTVMKKLNILLYLTLLIPLTSCEETWLDEKRDVNLVVPSTLKELRLMLNNSFPLVYDCRGLAELSGGDFYYTGADWQSRDALERNAYLWRDDLFDETTFLAEWDYGYQQALIANVALEGLENIRPEPGEQAEWNNVKGMALFFRARAFFNLSQLFAPPYDEQASTAPGIPLRLSSDIHASAKRATVQETGDRIIADLEAAAELLNVEQEYKTLPPRAAAYGLLARVYLSMRDYGKAWQYAHNALKDNDALLDYNDLNPEDFYPVPLFNDETVFYGTLASTFSGFWAPTGKVTPELYALYEDNDLRKTIFFQDNGDGSYSFKGHYSGGSSPFGGIATDELYLIRAEGYARDGNTAKALEDLNALLENRYAAGTFEPLTAANAEEALTLILRERRRQLPMRGLRWSDIRRLSFEPAHAVTLVREVQGITYELAPGDANYTLPIPDYAIQAAGIAPNAN